MISLNKADLKLGAYSSAAEYQQPEQIVHSLTPSTVLPPVGPVVAEYPLSAGQQALWFLQQLTPQSPAYNNIHAARIPTELDIPAFQRAIQRLMNRHLVLRTTFTASRGEPIQQVHEHMAACFQVEDASTWSEAHLNDRLAKEVYRPFDLEHGPLARVSLFSRSAQEHIVLLCMHHIVTDLWSLAILMHELGALYTEEKTGLPAAFKPLAVQYADYVRYQTEVLAGAEGERLWAYWQKQLTGELPVLNLPTDRPRLPQPTYHGACQFIKFEAGLTRQLKLLAKTYGTTLYTLLLAAFQVLLHRYTGQEDILVGSPKACRDRKVARLLGYFVNPIVLRANLATNPTFETFLNQVHQTVVSALEHGDYPFPLLVERLQPARDSSRSPLFQVMFAWQKTTHLISNQDITPFILNEAGQKMKLGELLLESMTLKQWIAPFDLTLLMAESGEELAATVEYSVDLFDAATIERMLEHFQVLLEGIATDPEQHLSDLPLLTANERQQLWLEWHDTAVNTPQEQSMAQLFETQVEQTPEAVALILETTQLTYAQLNRQANQLAHYLQQLGVGPETPVGIYMERSIEAIVGLLGILKAGGIYLPLDPAYPQERLTFMLEDAQVQILLTQAQLLDKLSPYKIPAVALDTEGAVIAQQSDQNLPCNTSGENLAYIIYTSGSTGKPKGVLISNEAIAAHCSHIQAHYQLTSGDRVLQFASLSFDQSLEQILAPLITGAALVLRGAEMWPPQQFPQLISDFGLTVINLPPAYWNQVVQEWIKSSNPLSNYPLRLVIIGGDAIPPESLHLWRQLPLHSVRLLNAYGPTETTITATTFEIPWQSSEITFHKVPIGQPLVNRRAYILDRFGRPVPRGVPGELHIGGEGLARGYLNRPDLTAEKFIPNPFETTTDRKPLTAAPFPLPGGEPGWGGLPSAVSGRLYKTGDLVRFRADGNIEFLGRVDQQVKVRGFRIELGEIEATLAQHPAVSETVVIAQELEPGNGQTSLQDRQLVAYLVPTGKPAPTSSELRHFLQAKLPAYMTPSTFVILESLPLTTSGKIDRRLLPVPDKTRPELDRAYVAPRTPIEEKLAEIWGEVLGLASVGIYDNFFDLGGHSLLATQFIARMRDTFQLELPLRTLFETSSIADLATTITQSLAQQEQQADLAQLLAELEALPEEAVQGLLADESAGVFS